MSRQITTQCIESEDEITELRLIIQAEFAKQRLEFESELDTQKLMYENSISSLIAYTSQKIYLEVIQGGCSLHLIPNEFKTLELCIIAVTKDPRNIYYLPEELKNSDVYNTLIGENSNIINYIEDDIITKELSLLAISKNTRLFV